MKRGVMSKGILTLIVFTFLLSGVFAALPDTGKCIINTRAECTGSSYHIVMGLSGLTNAHGEVAPGSYNDVLCCAFPGSSTCSGSNTIIKLSSSSNAHAEAPDQNNYLTRVCYSDLQCIGTSGTSCPANHPLEVLSLTSATNAHIGAFADYPVKICCSSSMALRSACLITAAQWTIPVGDIIEGQNVQMSVTGSGAECDGLLVSFDVQPTSGGNHGAIVQPMSIPFNGNTATGVWRAQHQAGFLGIGDASFRFNASIFINPFQSRISSNTITVKVNSNPIGTINVCSDYTVAGQCNADVEHVASKSSPSADIDCSAASTICSCVWDGTDGNCKFSYTKIDSGLTCNQGETKCYDTTTQAYYCYPGSTCPAGDASPCNNDGICDEEEGCTCADCNAKSDTCTSPLTCSGGSCGGTTLTLSHTTCSGGLCIETAGDGINQCLPLQATCTLPTTSHAICAGQSCMLASGSGTSECATSAECSGQSPGYTSCSGGSCNEVSGSGVSQCSPVSATCTIPSTSHAVCIGHTCALASGIGSDECSDNSGCGGIPGTTTCTSDVDCSAGQNCIDGICHIPIHTCTGVVCPVGSYCRDGTCGTNQTGTNGTVTCTKDSDCASGNDCIAGICFDPTTCSGVSCPSPSSCISGNCINDNGTIITDGCGYGYTLCNKVGLFYCYPGNTCPVGETPGDNNNGTCDFGSDGCSSKDCKDSDRDTCKIGLYCVNKKCGSVITPTGLNLSSCRITQTIQKDCNTEPTGYKTITWKGTWLGNTTSGVAYNRCLKGGTDNVPCPAEVQLPFFDYIELIITLVVIAGIYVSLVLKSKLKKRNK
jgi:hypothetical protein